MIVFKINKKTVETFFERFQKILQPEMCFRFQHWQTRPFSTVNFGHVVQTFSFFYDHFVPSSSHNLIFVNITQVV